MTNTPAKIRPKKSEVTDLDTLCLYCSGKCCRYFALPIYTPENWQDYDFIRWFLLHENATVFTEEGTWYLLVHTPCKHLIADNRCGIYHERPQICRDYTTEKCEYEDGFVYDQYFELSEQVDEYATAILGPRAK